MLASRPSEELRGWQRVEVESRDWGQQIKKLLGKLNPIFPRWRVPRAFPQQIGARKGPDAIMRLNWARSGGKGEKGGDREGKGNMRPDHGSHQSFRAEDMANS